ncbi:MAG: PqqD family protein [Elusimicrobiales bacterium]|nr:PqqD family protein [Elusimicrobiales bacterium]
MGWKPKKGLAHREIDGAVYIVDAAGSRLHRLNETGSFIWKSLAAGRPRAGIAAALADEFEVDGPAAEADAESFIRELEKAGLLEER